MRSTNWKSKTIYINNTRIYNGVHSLVKESFHNMILNYQRVLSRYYFSTRIFLISLLKENYVNKREVHGVRANNAS